MSNLNEQQIKAIDSSNNTVVVIAGAGSGKTTVLTEKIKKLILEDNVYANQILAITFTNKAATEMKNRVIEKLGPFASEAWIMTFHGFSLRIIKQKVDYLDKFDKNFLIIDEDDKKRILSTIIKKHQLQETIKVKNCMYAISYAKSKSLEPKDVRNIIEFDYYDIYLEYEQYLIENNSLDFDDLLLYANHLLMNPEVAEYYQNKFKNIHVDEFQDTSQVQFAILEKIHTKNNQLFIVGDIDQSIYGWRGAHVDNLINIEKSFKDVDIIKLEQNYRSTKNILDVANKLIVNNELRIEKKLWTENTRGVKVKGYRFSDTYKEADFVINEIKFNIEMKQKASQQAVIYRYNYQSKKIEEALIANQIPYKIYGGLRFFERMEIKDIISYIRLIYNHNDNISFNRVINVPKRKVGEVTLNGFRNNAIENETSLFASAELIGSKAVRDFCEIIKKYRKLLMVNFDEEFDKLLLELGYYQYLVDLDGTEKADDRMKNIEELKASFLHAIDNGQTLMEYLNELILFSEHDEDDGDCVILSTVHGVKGLEFDNVYMIGMAENSFPKRSSFGNISELEEERRVCYVAITRAKKKLVLSTYSFDYKGDYFDNSRFIEEMEIDIIENNTFSIF